MKRGIRMFIIAFIITYILVKIFHATQGVGATTPLTHQQEVEIIEPRTPNVLKTTHTVHSLKGGDTRVTHIRDKPRDLRSEYKRWKSNIEDYDRVRSKLFA